MFYDLAHILPTLILVIVLARFNSWNHFFFSFFKSFQTLGLALGMSVGRGGLSKLQQKKLFP